MVILHPFLSSRRGDPPRLSTPDGLERLTLDLAKLEAPVRLPKESRLHLMARITAEPARVETDRAGYITSINPAFTELCGFSFAEIKGQKPGSFLQGADTEPDAVVVLRNAVKAGESAEVEIINYHKDGSPYRVALSLEPVVDDQEQVTGFRAVAEKRSLGL